MGATLCCSPAQTSYSGVFCCCGIRAVGPMGSAIVALRLSCFKHVESSHPRDRTHVPCIGRWIPTHCTTKEVLSPLIFATLLSSSSPKPYSPGFSHFRSFSAYNSSLLLPTCKHPSQDAPMFHLPAASSLPRVTRHPLL